MSFETKDNSGALFKNDRKEADSHADYKGEARIDGHDVWVNAWINKTKDGRTYMKLGVKRKDGTAERPAQGKVSSLDAQRPLSTSQRAMGKSYDLDDEVPF